MSHGFGHSITVDGKWLLMDLMVPRNIRMTYALVTDEYCLPSSIHYLLLLQINFILWQVNLALVPWQTLSETECIFLWNAHYHILWSALILPTLAIKMECSWHHMQHDELKCVLFHNVRLSGDL